MILYAMMVRTSDGMPLSASIETDSDPVVRDAKRHIKMLAKQVKNVEDRCSLPLPGDRHVLHFTTAQGVSYMALCACTYPVVLAFSFLDELVKEFITTYTARDVSIAQRPYSFIQFDRVVQKTRQRYNNPSSLATKINLSDLSLEIRLRPPNQVHLGGIRRLVNVADQTLTNGTVAAVESFSSELRRQNKPLDILAIFLTALFVAFNLITGFLLPSPSRFEDTGYDVTSPFHRSISCLVEAALQLAQIYLMFKTVRFHVPWTCSVLLGLSFCNVYSWDVRDWWQMVLAASLAVVMATRSVQRRRPKKTPNYNV